MMFWDYIRKSETNPAGYVWGGTFNMDKKTIQLREAPDSVIHQGHVFEDLEAAYQQPPYGSGVCMGAGQASGYNYSAKSVQ